MGCPIFRLPGRDATESWWKPGRSLRIRERVGQGDEPGIASIPALLNCWRTTLSGLRATGAASLPNRQVP